MVALIFCLGLELFSYVLTRVNRLRIWAFLKACIIPLCILLKFSDKGVGRNEVIALCEAWGATPLPCNMILDTLDPNGDGILTWDEVSSTYKFTVEDLDVYKTRLRAAQNPECATQEMDTIPSFVFEACKIVTVLDRDFVTENENYYLDMTEKKFEETWNACLALLRVKADLENLDSED